MHISRGDRKGDRKLPHPLTPSTPSKIAPPEDFPQKYSLWVRVRVGGNLPGGNLPGGNFPNTITRYFLTCYSCSYYSFPCLQVDWNSLSECICDTVFHTQWFKVSHGFTFAATQALDICVHYFTFALSI